MSDASLTDILAREASEPGPWLTMPAAPRVGGVDPLGLRQINFDLMDRVFPGLNNVARHIRPFVLVTWAWHRTLELSQQRGLDLKVSVHEDFVARMEAAFVWSLIQEPDGGTRRVDLPGYQRITNLCDSHGELVLGDAVWLDFVKSRRDSTALTAAINYGPGLRAYHWLEDDRVYPGLRIPNPSTAAALRALERRLAPALGHDIFNGWDACVVSRAEALAWRDLWDLHQLTDEERLSMKVRLTGEQSSPERRAGFALLGAVASEADPDEVRFRKGMCDDDAGETFKIEIARWKRVQTRQAFRLALEALLHWMQVKLVEGPQGTESLARSFLAAAGGRSDVSAGDWLRGQNPSSHNPVDALEAVAEALRAKHGLAGAIAAALAFCLSGDESMQDRSSRDDRLPLARAQREAKQRADETAVAFIGHVIERWLFAQHTYWSVGRGLADARSKANPILRLRVSLEEDGWTLTRGGGSRPSGPRATPDRLLTAISLATEARIIGTGDLAAS